MSNLAIVIMIRQSFYLEFIFSHRNYSRETVSRLEFKAASFIGWGFFLFKKEEKI